jgi:pantoate--beta-alanine ligase
MEIFYEIAPLKKKLAALKLQNKTIGFVATMGALHQGHISLVENQTKKTTLRW